MDEKGELLGFDLDAISIVTEDFTLRLWKGNYAGSIEKMQEILEANGYTDFSDFLSIIGGSGGEIGLYNNDGKALRGEGGSCMTPEQMDKLGITGTSIQVINKSTGKAIGSRKESGGSFWTTVFSWFDRSKKEDLYTVNTFSFKDRSSAMSFAAKLNKAKESAVNYEHNRNQDYSVIFNVKNNTVTVIWGNE